MLSQDRKLTAGQLAEVARRIYLQDPRAKLQARDIEAFCPGCAAAMRSRNVQYLTAAEVSRSLNNKGLLL